ncbi:MAG: lipoyl synthase [Candidatus Hodarchaeales archaeon]
MKGTAKPEWIRAKIPTEKKFKELNSLLAANKLHTVCKEAFCPNRAECWQSGTATFLLMGEYCTRSCKFCDVTTKNPHKKLDGKEPRNLAQVIRELNLNYVVLTSVTRDDLQDGGAEHLAKCIKEIRLLNTSTTIEILIPDFKGNVGSLRSIVNSDPQVIGHNIETTESLTPRVRDHRASYLQSIEVLRIIKKLNSKIITKSSLLLGMGETDEDILKTLEDLKNVQVDIMTLGQYLQPSRKSIPVHTYITPQKFKFWRERALQIGFRSVVSGPMVRSSYKAGEIYSELLSK